jgi:glutamate 5-kinase
LPRRTPRARILLAKDGFATRATFADARNTSAILSERGVVPIADANDTVAIEGIKPGDYDNRATMVAHLVEPDVLIAHESGQINS